MAGERYVIFSMPKRLQHHLFTAAFTAAFITGAALPGGGGFADAAGRLLFGGPDKLMWWHAFFGLLGGMTIAAHLLYLLTRSYIEGIPWRQFPMRFGVGDLAGLAGEMMNDLRRRSGKPVRYTASRRCLYWIFLVGGTAVAASGGAMFYWDIIDSALISANLGALRAVHGGAAFFVSACVLAHIYLMARGGKPLLGLAISGLMEDEKLAAIYPDEYEQVLEESRKMEAKLKADDRARLEEEQRDAEKKTIEEILDRGNTLARDGAFEEAAEEYRRALNQFPFYSQAQYNLALVLEKAGRRDEALAAYRRFMEIDPFHPLAEKTGQAIARLKG